MLSRLRIREMVRKEFTQLFRDKKNRPLLIIAPLIQLILFGYVVTTDVREIRTALLDQSKTPESRVLVDAFNGNRTFHITHVVDHAKELDRLLLDRKVDVTIRVPPDFSSDIHRGHTASVQILADGSMSNIAGIRIVYANTVIDGLNKRVLLT